MVQFRPQQLYQVTGRVPLRIYVITLLTFLVFVSLFTWQRPLPRDDESFDSGVWQQLQAEQPERVIPREAAANSTLGFQKLLALSARPRWRTRGLLAAAHLTGLDFTIPPQPPNPDALVDAFMHIGDAQGKEGPALGSAKAWLAHLDLLKFVIASDLETAFIVEDDVDFDVRIRDQMKLASDNIRDFTRAPFHDTTPFGPNWDVLWLGHCGSRIVAGQEILEYRDKTAIPASLYAGWNGDNFEKHVPEHHRVVSHSVSDTVCTFGYGVTRSAAYKILSVSGNAGDEAFDVNLGNLCRRGVVDCLVVSPQLFQHYYPPEERGYVSEVDVADDQKASVDESVFEKHSGGTANIFRSARCKSLFDRECLGQPWRNGEAEDFYTDEAAR